ncbi:MAG: SH3 domain-containing protein, partial [Bacillota bacterium]
FGSVTGYVPTGALSLLGTAPESSDTAVSSVDGFAVVTASGYLNLRQSGSYSASVLATAPNGAIVTVLAWDASWAHIQYGTIVAYAASEFLSFSAEYPGEIHETDTADTGDTGDATDAEALSAIVATQSGSLNMRQFPQAGSSILTTIPQNAVVSVTEQGDTWSGVTYLGTSGYVMTMFLSFADETGGEQAGEQTEISAMVLTQSGSLNLRQLPKIGSPIYLTIPREQIVSVHTQDYEWCQVTYNGITGYVMTAFLSFIEAGDTGDTDDGDTTEGTQEEDTADDTSQNTGDDSSGAQATAMITTTSGSLNLRADALQGSRVLAKIPQGETVPVLQRMNTWTYTCYQEYYGYVMNAYLTFSDDEDDSQQSGDPIPAVVMTASGSLNLRDQPYGSVLTQIPQGTTVDVYSKGSAWCYLQYNGVFGYVMTAYLSFDTEDSQQNADTADTGDSGETDDSTRQTDISAATSATVTVETGSLNMRASRSETAAVLTTIPNGATVPILSQTSGWCKVSYGAFQGYVQTKYLSVSATPPPTATPTPAPTGTAYSLTAWVNTASGSLNLRETASSGAAVLALIPQYAQVDVLSDIAQTWCQARYESAVGYVMSEYLTTAQPTASPEPTATPDTGDSGETDTGDDVTMDPTLHEPSREIIVYVRPPAGSATLALYEACLEDSEILQDMIENSEVEIVRVGDTWCEVIYMDQLGYCMRDGLSFFEE